MAANKQQLGNDEEPNPITYTLRASMCEMVPYLMGHLHGRDPSLAISMDRGPPVLVDKQLYSSQDASQEKLH